MLQGPAGGKCGGRGVRQERGLHFSSGYADDAGAIEEPPICKPCRADELRVEVSRVEMSIVAAKAEYERIKAANLEV